MNYYDKVKKVDNILREGKFDKDLFSLIKDKSIEEYFFKNVSFLGLFFPLKEKGYFSPERAPAPKPADKEDYFTIPHWNVLDYLEKVSQQINQPGNEKYVDELLEIIRDITNYHTKNNKILDNYRTWWYFVKILCNMPNEKIEDEIINLIPIWLDSKFGITLPAKEVLERLLPKFLDSSKPEDLKKAERIVDIVTEIKLVPKYTQKQKEEIKEKYKDMFNKPKELMSEEEKPQIALLGLDDEEPKTIVDTYWLLESFVKNKIADKVGEKCSEKVIFDLADKLTEIFKRKDEKFDFSYIWFRSIFDVSGHISGVEETLTLILRNIILAKARKDKKTVRTVFFKFLGDKYRSPLFKRLVLFVIGTEWNIYKDVFWKMLAEDKESDFFNDPHYEPEIYVILQKCVSQFSPEEKEKIKNIIEEKVPLKPHPEEKYKEYYSAYQKQKWYSAVKFDDYFKPLYDTYRNITQEEEEVHFREPEVRVGPGPSPLTKEAILKMSNEELAEYLNVFKTVDFWKGPTIGGLSDALKDAVEENPEKFISNLEPFIKIGYLYVCDIMWGIRDAWTKKKVIDWGKVFEFIKQYITPKDFWDDKYKIEGDNRNAKNHLWVASMVAALIREGIVDDSWAFSEQYFQTAQEIIFQILDSMLSEKEKILNEEPITGDSVGYALNSSFGKITEALFMLALRIKRVEEKSKGKQEVSWQIDIKDKYEELLNKEIIQSYTWLGIYLLHFYYHLDKEWTKNKITVTIEKGQLWEAFMDGYLSCGKVYNELYNLMKPHYEKAIDYRFKEKYSPNQLVQHICIGYLRGIEDINDSNSLFRKLLDKWDISQIEEIIGFFWMQRRDYEQRQEEPIEDKERIIIENKIIAFWRWVYENKYKGKQENEFSSDDKKILSGLCNLTVFLTEINSVNFEWLKISALYADVSFYSSFFIEYLDRLKDKVESPKYIGEIFLKMLEGSTPDFRTENIQSIVEFLYQSNNKGEADKICNIYGSRGYEFLRSLYDQYNKR